MKQPGEDAPTGVDRDDFLLSLDERAIPHREALIGMARHLWAACLVGNPAPLVERMYERIIAPEPGDLVAESSVLHGHAQNRPAGLGVLLEKRREWMDSDAEWAEYIREGSFAADDERPSEDVWYVQYGSKGGDVCRWVNCSFVVLPLGLDFSAPVGRNGEGGRWEFTGTDLLDKLADSGFAVPPDGRLFH